MHLIVRLLFCCLFSLYASILPMDEFLPESYTLHDSLDSLLKEYFIELGGDPHEVDTQNKSSTCLQTQEMLFSRKGCLFVCNNCTSTFSQKKILFFHYEVKHGICRQCSQHLFNDDIERKEKHPIIIEHYKNFHNEFIELCAECEKCAWCIFCPNKKSAQYNLLNHLINKHQTCPFCSKRFSTKSRVKEHIRTDCKKKSADHELNEAMSKWLRTHHKKS